MCGQMAGLMRGRDTGMSGRWVDGMVRLDGRKVRRNGGVVAGRDSVSGASTVGGDACKAGSPSIL